MNRTHLGRLVGTLAVAAGLMLGLLSNTSSAQVIDSAPKARVAADRADSLLAQGSASSYSAETSGYWECGYWRNGDAYYTHCGSSAFPRIEVSFMWGWTTRTIQISGGTANLTTHPKLQGAGMITGARCVADCW